MKTGKLFTRHQTVLIICLCHLTGCASSTQRPILFDQAVAFATKDGQNALAGARAAGDAPGVVCHQAFLDWLSSLQFPVMTVSGIASAGEAVRLKEAAIRTARTRWAVVADLCAPIFPVGAVVDRLMRLLR